ncbi:MAG: pantoate--beta-alanine ligase [Owenweeksia sp.]
MQVFERADELSAFVKNHKNQNHSVGFVPTMGALHEGHLSLVRHALRDNDVTVVSIFVNPTQFNNQDDLARYPRVPKADLKLLESINTPVVFLPAENEIYPHGTKSNPVYLNGLDEHMEGRFRPGHFQGVVTVVKRFFDIASPTRAYFGEKDYQQLLIIRQMAKHYNLDTEIISHQVERGPNGLALSSRNELMPDADKNQAKHIYSILEWARHHFHEYVPGTLQEEIEKRFSNSPLKLEYALVSDPETLEPINEWDQEKGARLFIAAYMGSVRLIDNVSLF